MPTIPPSRAHGSDRRIGLLEELGLEFTVETFERDPKTQRAQDEMQTLHPLAKALMLGDGDRILIPAGKSTRID